MLQGKVDEKVIIKNLATNVAVSEDKLSYAEDVNLSDCKELNLVFICPPITIMSAETHLVRWKVSKILRKNIA